MSLLGMVLLVLALLLGWLLGVLTNRGVSRWCTQHGESLRCPHQSCTAPARVGQR